MKPRVSLSRRAVLLALAASALPACGRNQALAEAADADVALSWRVERFGLRSEDGQRAYRIELLIPQIPAPATGHPLLVMLDGNAVAAELTSEVLTTALRGGQPPVIAKLGYETSGRVDRVARAFDYTPPVPGEDPTWDDEASGRLGGGAEQFLDLYEQQILPELLRREPIDRSRSTFWGHSYGGLLVLYALFTRPGLFARYASADPSLWWHHGFMLSVAERAAKMPERGADLLLMAGSAGQDVQRPGYVTRPGGETAAAREARERRRSVPPDATEQLGRQLAELPGLNVEWRPFPGVSHGPMRAASFPDTLRFAMR